MESLYYYHIINIVLIALKVKDAKKTPLDVAAIFFPSEWGKDLLAATQTLALSLEVKLKLRTATETKF